MNTNSIDLYVSTMGHDLKDGSKAVSDGSRSGPLKTPQGAVKTAEKLCANGTNYTQINIHFQDGIYSLDKMLKITPEIDIPLKFIAQKKGKAIFDGGQKIEDLIETTHNGIRAWTVVMPEVALGNRYFRQLFVNGRRCSRSRFPAKEGTYLKPESTPKWSKGIPKDPKNERFFYAKKGDFKSWENLEDIEVRFFHFWNQDTLEVSDFNPETNLVSVRRPCHRGLGEFIPGELPDYYIENVFEELKVPGTWYLNRKTGAFIYLPLEGETLSETEIYAPRLDRLLELRGEPEEKEIVKNITFDGIVFRHAAWNPPQKPGEGMNILGGVNDLGGIVEMGMDYASSSQAASTTPGALFLRGAERISFYNCRIEHVGGYGIELNQGCKNIEVINCDIEDTGAGAFKAGGVEFGGNPLLKTGKATIEGCRFSKGGRVFNCGVGIFLEHTFGNRVRYNDIWDYYYTGISVGWVWAYGETAARENIIEYNHIWKIGQGVLSDLGGIYLLGEQPGTEVRGNVIHDVEAAVYNGNGIYADEGCSNVLFEKNLVYNVSQFTFHQHFGRENILRNNIFAYPGTGCISYGRTEPHIGFSAIGNLLIPGDDIPSFFGRLRYKLQWNKIRSDLNYIYLATDKKPICRNAVLNEESGDLDRENFSWKEWLALGNDNNSKLGGEWFTEKPDKNIPSTLIPKISNSGFITIDEAGASAYTGLKNPFEIHESSLNPDL